MSTRYALISVSDRTGVVEFARVLASCGFGILSTGGTAAALRDGGIAVTEVSDITGAPEILDGRVKTLHPTIHGGILARRDVQEHADTLDRLGIPHIDVVVNNLYPFTAQVRQGETTLQDAVELIDIGGPAMTRAAAKNYEHVVVVVDPGDYVRVGKMLTAAGVPLWERTRLALKAFQHVAHYDAAIADYLRAETSADGRFDFPAELTFGYRLAARPRYGENPHQSAGVYASPGSSTGIVNAELLHGIEMSYLNYYDADAAWSVAQGFADGGDDSHVAAIVKHANPCGLAVRNSQPEAWTAALAGDPVSAFGGIVAFNHELQADTATEMAGLLLDVIVAPSYATEALELLRKRRRTRVLKVRRSSTAASVDTEIRTVSGGVLVQSRDVVRPEERDGFKVVSQMAPTQQQLDDMWFAWRACRFVRSNAIALAKDNALVGMGAGQPNRVTSVELACRVAGDDARGSAMASDAFFPFPDGIELAAANGVTSVVQPGGSVNDDAVIAAADNLGIAMVFTGTRHFYH